ncbi:MAG: aldehyde dehydrogenase family protein [Thiohalocapsa sp.]|nr:aldehyde dehydrogenase family protein [Thiohalocapsa sp.]
MRYPRQSSSCGSTTPPVARRPGGRTALAERCALLRRVADLLRERRETLAALITAEMGKLIGESEAEIDKCAALCEHDADEAGRYLADEEIGSDASRSLVAYQPLGVVLAVMPWNFPFWQAFRCTVPALAAGNTLLLKHASNVPQCALAIETLLRDAGAPAGVFSARRRHFEKEPSLADCPEVGIDPRRFAAVTRGASCVLARRWPRRL